MIHTIQSQSHTHTHTHTHTTTTTTTLPSTSNTLLFSHPLSFLPHQTSNNQGQFDLPGTMATTHVINSSNPGAHLASSGSHSSSSSNNIVGVHYKVGKKIGEGSFGVIFEGTNLLNSQTVAIKFVSSVVSSAVKQVQAFGQQIAPEHCTGCFLDQ